MIRCTIHFSGQVQGVGFRHTTMGVAARFAVCGYVQNLADGRVRVVAEGEPAALDGFVAEICRCLGRHIRARHEERSAASGEFGPPGAGSFGLRY